MRALDGMTALGARPRLVGGVVVAALLSAIGFFPLFGGPGYEHALASGLIVPSAAAIATALASREANEARTPLRHVGEGVVTGLAYAGVALATALVHGLRVGFCDLLGGVETFVLTAGLGSALGGLWGAISGELARGRKRPRLACVLFALAGPASGIAVSLVRFFTSPMIFAFDPFVGHFSGTLYDTVTDAGVPLLTYRLGTLATLVGACLVASVMRRRCPLSAEARTDLTPPRALRASRVPPSPSLRSGEGGGGDCIDELPGKERALGVNAPSPERQRGRGGWGVRSARGARARLVLGVLALAASVAITVRGDRLGHWQTSASIAEALAGRRVGARCEVIFPAGSVQDDGALLLRDCEEHLAEVERALGARGPERVRAYFFRDAGDKRRLMGAADTYIAKPWRAEVYLQLGSYPHPVLGHELAHVVAGSFGRGPFKVAGAAFGLWPNPGLIEGVATAASPDEDELEATQWARAMLDLGLLPPLDRVFSLGFLGDNAARSYTVAAAFVRWVTGRFGAATLRAWYGGADLERLTGKRWSALDDEFRASLAQAPLPERALAYAKGRFSRPGVFGRRCPHVVDALRGEADGCRDGGRPLRAIELYDDVLARDPHDEKARLGRGLVLERVGRADGRRTVLALATDERATRSARDRAEVALADLDFTAGRFDAAATRYRDVAARSLDEDAARTLEVKAIGALDAAERPIVQALLLGDAAHRADLPAALSEVIAAARIRELSPLDDYLVGRNLVQRGFYEAARPYLGRALVRGLPTSRLGREALKQRAIVACVLGEEAEKQRVRARANDPAGPFGGGSGGRLGGVLRLLERCGKGG